MTDYQSLYELQDKLIEHKYPIEGIWATEIMHAGDVYRGLAKNTPDPWYVCEKIHFLTNFIEKQPLNRADFEEFAYYSGGGYHKETGNERYASSKVKERLERFRGNLRQLRKITAEGVDDPVRKRCLVDSLDMIKALADYYERSPTAVPVKEWRRMKTSVNKCLPRRCVKQKSRW